MSQTFLFTFSCIFREAGFESWLMLQLIGVLPTYGHLSLFKIETFSSNLQLILIRARYVAVFVLSYAVCLVFTKFFINIRCYHLVAELIWQFFVFRVKFFGLALLVFNKNFYEFMNFSLVFAFVNSYSSFHYFFLRLRNFGTIFYAFLPEYTYSIVSTWFTLSVFLPLAQIDLIPHFLNSGL